MADCQWKNDFFQLSKCPHDATVVVKRKRTTKLDGDDDVREEHLCIFHAPVEGKNAELFWKEFDELLVRHFTPGPEPSAKKEWGFAGFEFPAMSFNPSDKYLYRERESGAILVEEERGRRTKSDLERVRSNCAITLGSIWSAEDRVGIVQSKFLSTWDDDVDFTAARFAGVVIFDGVTFGKRALFRGATFENLVMMDDVTFKGPVSFREARFHRASTFWGVKFVAPNSTSDEPFVDMRGAHFPRGIEFRAPRFYRRVRWQWPGTGRSRAADGKLLEAGTLVLQKIEQSGDGFLDIGGNDLSDKDVHLRFEDCAMHNVVFGTTDASEIQFHDCTWPQERDFVLWPFEWWPFFPKRDAVGDEIVYNVRHSLFDRLPPRLTAEQAKRLFPESLTEIEQARRVRQTYQQLAEVYTANSDKVMAVEFERGVFEMRRREEFRGRSVKGAMTALWLTLYRHTSHYSGNVGLVVVWLAAITYGFGLLYECQLENLYEKSERVTANSDEKNNPAYVEHLEEQGMTLALRLLAVDRSWFAELDTKEEVYQTLSDGDGTDSTSQQVWKINTCTLTWLQIASLVQTVFTVTLFSLFGLAMRRKFKH